MKPKKQIDAASDATTRKRRAQKAMQTAAAQNPQTVMSRYLTETKTLFVHIPRTGGVWVNQALRAADIPHGVWRTGKIPHGWPRKHALPYMYGTHLGKVQNAFAFVRQPRAYYESVWRFNDTVSSVRAGRPSARTAYNRRFRWHPFQIPARYHDDDPNVWLSNMLTYQPGWYAYLIDLYVGPAGGEFCQHIGRTEHLPDDFCRIMRALGYNAQIDVHEEELCNTPPTNCRRTSEHIAWDEKLLEELDFQNRDVLGRFYDEG